MANLLFIEGLELDFFNPRSIICFIAILQGATFAALLFSRYVKQKKKADFWLAILLFVLCAALITPFIGFANVYDRNQWLTYFPFAVAYSYGVLVWLYTVYLTDSKRQFLAKDLLLFAPAVLYLSFRFFGLKLKQARTNKNLSLFGLAKITANFPARLFLSPNFSGISLFFISPSGIIENTVRGQTKIFPTPKR